MVLIGVQALVRSVSGVRVPHTVQRAYAVCARFSVTFSHLNYNVEPLFGRGVFKSVGDRPYDLSRRLAGTPAGFYFGIKIRLAVFSHRLSL